MNDFVGGDFGSDEDWPEPVSKRPLWSGFPPMGPRAANPPGPEAGELMGSGNVRYRPLNMRRGNREARKTQRWERRWVRRYKIKRRVERLLGRPELPSVVDGITTGYGSSLIDPPDEASAG